MIAGENGKARKIILSADSTCDIGPVLQERYGVRFFDFHIQVGDKSFVDRTEISQQQIYDAWRNQGILPKTAAISPGDYSRFFEEWVADGYEVVHINLGSTLSSAYQNCCIAASETKNVYPIDSANLSSGSGLLVVKAGEMIRAGFSAPDIQKALSGEMRSFVSASFILDTLEFMAAGGRCKSITAFGANLLRLKPCIEVDNLDGGNMKVGKLYRGSIEKVLPQYVKNKLENCENIDFERIFITHSGSPKSDVDLVRKEIAKYASFRDIYVTEASGTICSHCGPRTLGILFMRTKA